MLAEVERARASTHGARQAARRSRAAAGVARGWSRARRETPTGRRMRRQCLSGARVALLAGPTVLAFFTGGYFDDAARWAGLIAWLLVAVALLAGPAVRCRAARPAWLAIGGLGAARRLDAAVGHVGAGRGQRVPARADRRALHGRAARGGDAAPRARSSQRAVEPALAAGSADRDRLRDLRRGCSRACCTSRARSAPRAGSSSR